MDTSRRPCLYFRDKDGHGLGFFSNDPDTRQRLAGLCDFGHRFELHSAGHVLVFNAGYYDASRVKLVDARRMMTGHGPAFTPVPGQTLNDTCANCERRGPCQDKYNRLQHTLPYPFEHISGRHGREPEVMELMKNSMEANHRRLCPLVDFDEDAISGANARAPTRDELREIGFEPLTSVRAFYGDGSIDADVRERILAVCPDLDDLEVIGRHVHLYSILNDDAFPSKMTVADLDFDADSVYSRVIEQKIRGLNAQSEKKKYQDFRARECANCVYDCKRPPYNHEDIERCHLTPERAIEVSGYEERYTQLAWMALHTLSGHAMRVGMKRVMTYAPTSGLKIERVARAPPYGRWDEVDPETVIQSMDRHPIFPLDDEKVDTATLIHHVIDGKDRDQLGLCYWALNEMHAICRCHEATFRFDNRPKRNDILYIRLRRDLSIEVGSDTRASSHGGMSRRGRGIGVDERPRFTTDYSPPYFDSFTSWFGITPGARGRK